MADFVPYTGQVVAEKPAGGFAPYSGEVVAEKPRTWSDTLKQGVGAVPRSVGKLAKELYVDPVLHPVDTFNSFKDLIGGFISKTGRPGEMRREGDPEPTPEELQRRKADEAALDNVAEFYKKRYGSMEGFKKALAEDPASVAMDLGTIVSGFEGAAGKVPGLGIARRIDPAKVLGAAAKTPVAVGNVGSEVLGHFLGGGPESVKQSVRAGYAPHAGPEVLEQLGGMGGPELKKAVEASYNKELSFLAAIEKKLPLEDTVKWASKSVGKMRQERNAQYQTAMKALGKQTEVIDFNKVLQGWQDAQKIGHYEGVALAERTAGLDTKVLNTLDQWHQLGMAYPEKFFSPLGIDALKKKVRNLKESVSPTAPNARVDRAYLGDLENTLKREIEAQAPVYKKIMKDYAVASDGLEEIEKALSLGDKASYDTGIRKLLGAMRDNANSNNANRLKMIDTLEEHGAKGLKSALAGSQMSSAFPRGLASNNPFKTGIAALFKPGLLGTLPLQSPKFVGKKLYRAGEMAGDIRDLLKGTVVPDESVLKSIPQLSPEVLQRLIYLQNQGKQQ